jgi:hypothetical protein
MAVVDTQQPTRMSMRNMGWLALMTLCFWYFIVRIAKIAAMA